jgi:osmotically-inducible protein OsmY
MNRYRIALATIVSIVTLLTAAPATADRDEAITARVKQALIAGGISNAADIEVKTFQGEVDLSGAVRSERTRDEAARISGVVQGVTAVRNGLRVRQPSGDRDSDDVLVDRVRKALITAGLRNAQDIKVKAFNGEVDLSGTVISNDGRETAGRVVGEVRGVTAVRNGLVVQHP